MLVYGSVRNVGKSSLAEHGYRGKGRGYGIRIGTEIFSLLVRQLLLPLEVLSDV